MGWKLFLKKQGYQNVNDVEFEFFGYVFSCFEYVFRVLCGYVWGDCERVQLNKVF